MKEISVRDLYENAMELIGDDWLLLTAGNGDSYNMMTASWGMIGHLWHKDVCSVFIRPQRYTYEFFEKHDTFSVSVLPESLRHIMTLCGKESGRDTDKMHLDGLTPVETDGTVYFREARLVFVCKKLYTQDLKEENFCDTAIVDRHYPAKDYHRMYVGEIIRTLSE